MKTLFCLLLASLCLHAQKDAERITSFDSDITVNPDGSITVTETIKVHATGDRIKHGIYRDFPTRYKDHWGNRYTVSFRVSSVSRDGKPEDFFTEGIDRGMRVYVGKKGSKVPPGDYAFAITYIAGRELRFYEDHDELYWNVTGNGWAFPIDRASAVVRLPKDVKKESISADGFTGEIFSTQKNFESSFDADGNAVFKTTKPLASAEGMTILVKWPKGFVREPTRAEELSWFIHDNLAEITALFGLLVVTIYYFVTWFLVGRDPPAGTIIPLFGPPNGMTPEEVRYIMNMGMDDKIFTCAVINMAVKGFWKIRNENDSYSILRGAGNKEALTALEAGMADDILGEDEKIVVGKDNWSKFAAAKKRLAEFLEKGYNKKFFFTNTGYFGVGVLISVLSLAGAAIFGGLDDGAVAAFMMAWLSIWSIGTFALVGAALTGWYSAFRTGKGFGSAVLISLFALPFFAAEIVGLVFLADAASVELIVIMGLLIFVNILFYKLLKAPTIVGRKVMDQIEGFKLYLSVAEKRRLNLENPPQKTPQLFEKFLPYALALDVEQDWAEQFAEVLSVSTIGGREYTPSWYSGAGWTAGSIGTFSSSLGSSFSSAVSSASTAPGSHSGGGGFSGGGGGGGGGGGW